MSATVSILGIFLSGLSCGITASSLHWQYHNEKCRQETIEDCIREAETILKQRQAARQEQSKEK